MKWYFNRLTPDQKALARQYYEERNTPPKPGEKRSIIKLMNLYNNHKVSPDFLTPCCSINQTLDWTQWAIQKGEI